MKFFTIYIPLLIIFLSFSAAGVFAQKAEPMRIKFAKGKSSATITNTLSNDEEMDLVFSAKKDQSVSLKVSSKPKGNFFDFTLGGDGFDLETEMDSYSEYAFRAPETGDYLVTVRKRPTETAPTAKFYLVLTIR
ncbi:MAG: hypothetical protein IPK58_21955 [Acidobacteria bacterium]|nr:hypothetical protein [Acidobacteriota bacterium]